MPPLQRMKGVTQSGALPGKRESAARVDPAALSEDPKSGDQKWIAWPSAARVASWMTSLMVG